MTKKGTMTNGVDSAQKLIGRILPVYKDAFSFKIEEHSEREFFRVSASNNKIEIEGSNPVCLASAVNWYLKYNCNCHFSWSGDQLSLPESLPIPKEEIKYTANFNYRYYLNYCTFSYSMPWWTWERWEKEIDWMALNGVNLVLALNGQDAVWQNLLSRLNVSASDIFDFLPGPAFSAWQWLGNLDGWGGPVSQSWINSQKELQIKILKRLREFGITPILQAFTGRVPKSLIKIFPEAKIEQLPGWYGYEGIYFLDPSDPLFDKLSKLFLEEQTKLYGNDHYFAGDVFHELDSPSESSDYLKEIYKGIQKGLLSVDDSAIWVLQSWTIREESIDVLDKNHTLILDLFCDSEPKWKNTNAFGGHPWVWTIINNFGGRIGFGGKLKLIAEEVRRVKNSLDKGKLVGLGMAPEGIGNNPVIYDLLMEMNWNAEIGDLKVWLEKFTSRRYGLSSSHISVAWQKLLNTVYSGPKNLNYPPVESIVCALPSFEIEKVGSNGSTDIYYNSSELLESLELLIKEKDTLKNVKTYIIDVIDITRQLAVSFAYILYTKIKIAFSEKNVQEFVNLSDKFLQFIEDLDQLLSSDKYFSIARWLNDAKAIAENEDDAKLFEWNARRQITLWSTPEITEFHDYANKQWGGLLKSYYLPRWEKYFTLIQNFLQKDKEFSNVEFKNSMLNWGVEWSNQNDAFVINDLDPFELVEKFLAKYKELLKESNLISFSSNKVQENVTI